jgi:hypothetical protein
MLAGERNSSRTGWVLTGNRPSPKIRNGEELAVRIFAAGALSPKMSTSRLFGSFEIRVGKGRIKIGNLRAYPL